MASLKNFCLELDIAAVAHGVYPFRNVDTATK